MASLQKKMVKGIEYWSLIESKRINGKPTPIVIEYFGNTKSFAEKLMNGRNENKILKSYSHGDTYALLKMAERFGIEHILDSILKPQTRNGVTRSKSLLLIALQSICNPGSKSEFESWVSTTTLPYELNLTVKFLTSQHFWDQMHDITEDELAKAEDAIVQKIFSTYNFGLHKIALDYTNYFSYISSANEKCEIAKRGHNKQKRNDLRQYSLALVTTREAGLPLFSHVYEGNKNDQTEFYEYISLLKKRIPDYNPETITLIFDSGSNNKKNFDALETHYICSFSLASCKSLYDVGLSEYADTTINEKSVRCYRITHEIWGKERECILTYSHALYTGQIKELNRDIASVIRSLKELNEQLDNPKSRMEKSKEAIQAKIKKILSKKYMGDIFETQVREQESGSPIRVEYLINDTNKEMIAYKYFGKKLLISDHKDWSTSDILRAYREQDCIEKIFRATKDKDHCAIRPQFHYTDQKIRVHIFCSLLGLTLATILYKEISKRGFTSSKFHLLDVLSSIRRCWIKDKNSNKATNVLEAMDNTQTTLWNIIQAL
jgi:transposase